MQGTPEPTPLAAYPYLHSSDFDEIQQTMTAVFCPHTMRLVDADRALDTQLYHRRLSKCSLNIVQYGATVEVSPGPLDDFYLVQLPDRGSSELTIGTTVMRSDSGMASITSPTENLSMVWSGDCRKLVLRIERSALEHQLAALLGAPSPRPLVFAPSLDMATPLGASWRRLLDYVLKEVGEDGNLMHSPLMLGQIEDMILTLLVECQPHSHSDALAATRQPAAPRYVKRAEDFMLAHLDQPIGLVDLAAASGVSARTLHYGFRNFRGLSPMQFLLGQRLDRVHAALLAPSPGDTITALALAWGFGHIGHFSVAYRKRFGCTPSATLRKAL